MGDNVRVAVRVRPMSEREKDMKSSVVVRMQDRTTFLSGPVVQKNHSFTFDYSLWSLSRNDSHFVSQEGVFQLLGTPLLDWLFEGYNTCLLAYGQTGSGKTYSVVGYYSSNDCDSSERGVIPRVCQDLFTRIEKCENEDWTAKVEMSYFEIYCEKCHCLLNPSATDLKVREHPVTGPFLDRLTKIIVHDSKEVLSLLNEGNRTRSVASTAMNATSSRSHALFTLTLYQRRRTRESTWSDMVSSITLVDLAGSERANKSKLDGTRLQEGANINRSLTTLGKVISALAEHSSGAAGNSHVPYRDSVLTWLLKEQLSGNSKTIMLATISPTASNYEETLSTLRYADNAKRIVTKAIVNEDPHAKVIRELQDEIERLKGALLAQKSEVESPQKDMASDQYNSLPYGKQLEITETMLNEVKEKCEMSWDEMEQKDQQLREERSGILQAMGIQSTSVHVPPGPCLINLDEDAFLSGCLVFPLVEAAAPIKVGKMELNNSTDSVIRLSSSDILTEHAVLDFVNGAWSLSPLSGNAFVYINGKKICTAETLSVGDRVIFGQRHIFRYHIYETENDVNSLRTHTNAEWQAATLEKHEYEKQCLENDFKQEVERLTRLVDEKVITTKCEPAAQDEFTTQMESLALAQKKAQQATLQQNQADMIVHRWRILLVGHEEVGKTSLRKCFLSDPFFFKRLPDVTATIGIEQQTHVLSIEHMNKKCSVRLYLYDFAGQECYHSHSLFLTPRSIYAFVWKMSTSFSHVMGEFEYNRMTQWIDEIYAKVCSIDANVCIILIGTHLDELEDQVQGAIVARLRNVRQQLMEYISTILRSGDKNSLEIRGNFAVSCKTRLVICEDQQAFPPNTKFSSLLQFFAHLALKCSVSDRAFPNGILRGNVFRAIQDFEAQHSIRRSSAASLLLPSAQLLGHFEKYGVTESQFRAVAGLLHCWNLIYIPNFSMAHQADCAYFFSNPLWLGRMVSCMYSFAHVLRTPVELRSFLSKVDFDIDAAISANRGGLSVGMISFQVTKILLYESIAELKMTPVVLDEDVDFCIKILEALDVIFPVGTTLHPSKTLGTRTVSKSMYYIPRLFSKTFPQALQDAMLGIFKGHVCRSYQTNILPRDFFGRLYCKLQSLLLVISIPTPLTPDGSMNVDFLTEALFYHSLWKNALYCGSNQTHDRAFIIESEGLLYVYCTSLLFFDKLNISIMSLLTQYPGLSIRLCMNCPSLECQYWFDEDMVNKYCEKKKPLSCPNCSHIMTDQNPVIQNACSPTVRAMETVLQKHNFEALRQFAIREEVEGADTSAALDELVKISMFLEL